MNKRNLIGIGFAVVVALQLAVPAWMIAGHELALKEGRLFKFKTRPVDPADAFRGRYVWLSLEPDTVKVSDVNQWPYGKKAFAVLGVDSNGFATVKRLESDAPANDPSVKVETMGYGVDGSEVHLRWPGLDRYYMQEGKAPAAETAYRQHSLRTNQTCHVTVRVYHDTAVIEDLFIEDQPIQTWLREHK